MVLADVHPDVSNPDLIVYEFITFHVNFTQYKNIKLDETFLDTQGHFKANLLNVMDVLGRLTSKLYVT